MNIPSVIFVLFLLSNSTYSMSIRHNKHRKRHTTQVTDSTCFGSIPLCNSSSTYPETDMRRLLMRNRSKFDPIFGTVIEPAKTVDRSLFKSLLEDEEEESFCKTRRVTVTPRTAYDELMNKRYIVNVDDYIQSITFEMCATTECFGSESLEFFNYRTYCRQLYSVVRLLYYDEENQSIEYGRFSIPSACVCTYQRGLNL